MSKGVQIAVGATLIAGLFGWYGATNLDAGDSFTYYQSLAEFQTASEAHAGSAARVHGYVANDSIQRDVAARRVHFLVQNDPPHAGGEIGPTLAVVLTHLETPDLFKDGAEVVLEGRMVASGPEPAFHADKVLAKCPSKFEPQTAESAQI